MEKQQKQSTTTMLPGDDYLYKSQYVGQQWQKKRKELFAAINGDAFFPLKTWPSVIVEIFWNRPMSDSLQ